MPTTFPASVDNFYDPVVGDSLGSAHHDTMHINLNDALEAVEGLLLGSVSAAVTLAGGIVGLGTTDGFIHIQDNDNHQWWSVGNGTWGFRNLWNNGTGFSWYAGSGGNTQIANLDGSGNMTVAGSVSIAASILGFTGGDVVIRPNGVGSSHGQLYLATTGLLATYTAAGVRQNTLDDGLGNMSLVGQIGTTLASAGFGAFTSKVSGDTSARWLTHADGATYWGPGNATQDVALYRSSANTLTLDNGSGGAGQLNVAGSILAFRQLYPGAEAFGAQSSGGFLHSTGVPSNSNGNNNDWCISDNGHLYFKSAGSWVQKV